MESRADLSDGDECGRVGAGEGAQGDVEGLLLRLLDLIALDAGRNETGGDAGIRRAVSVVFAVDGEVEAVTVKRFAVDFDWVGSCHGFDF